MASYSAQYYYTLTIADGVATIAGGPFSMGDPYVLVSQEEPGPGEFSPGDLIDASGSAETYTGYTSEGPVTDDQFLYTDNGSLTAGQELAYTDAAFTVCFLAGTMIATPAGETPVESLAIGDLVLTADGRAAPVRWVGVQTVVTPFADRLLSYPIRITAGALGEGLPVRDLLVSPDHALFLDGVLVQASALVNGTTIVRETAMPDRFTWFHVELDDHALILAEGVPAETFLDTVTRRRFDNFADYVALYGDADPRLAEIAVPRVKSARQLPRALRERLALAAGGAVAKAAA
ncbi:Hint domain-containing protein [Pseudoxanthobacter sp. M-2]|uniref:Hint domain-containing protein n=1 Tax=Pseudoxanthobacter sp. M-2 TaxID=3078754 RepID=UPI0038FCDFF2